MKSKKLYRVTLRGMTHNSTGTAFGTGYVVATGTDDAYKKVRKFLDDNNIGFSKDRELDKIELLAECDRYTDTGCMLYV
jgi:hypothetical protein